MTNMFIGGDFTSVSIPPDDVHKFAACVDSNTSAAIPALRAWNPDVNSTVKTAVLSGSDMYLGGQFTAVQGYSRSRAACVSATVTEATPTLRAWDPNCNSDVEVMVISGSNMYLGGQFTTVRGEARNRAACVDATVTAATPTLRAWNPNCNAAVRAMVTDGFYIWLGGSFTTVGAYTRNRAACVEANVSSAAMMGWDPNCNGDVYAMIRTASYMYLGGSFTTVGGSVRNRAACVGVGPGVGLLYGWDPNCDAEVSAMVLSGSDMYLGGGFSTVRSTSRTRAACVDATASSSAPSLRAWAPSLSASVNNMYLSGGNIFFVGAFTRVGSTSRLRVACVDATVTASSPSIRAWNPSAANIVNTLVFSGSDVYAFGIFGAFGFDARVGAAIVPIDSAVASPALRPWNPGLAHQAGVRSMVRAGSHAYLGGSFTFVQSIAQNRAACFSSLVTDTNPTLRAWNPDCIGSVEVMVLSGSNMYLGGSFMSVRATTRNRVACVDATATDALPALRAWNPNCSNTVKAMILSGSNMYLGGSFTTVSGNVRNRAACVEATVTAATPALRNWDPNCNGDVLVMILSGSDMYLGGAFTTVGVYTRNFAACVDATVTSTAPALRAWDPNCNNWVFTMVLSGSDMYLGGIFTTVRGSVRNNAACVSAIVTDSAPALRAWNPDCNNHVYAMTLVGSDVYLGGNFWTVRGTARERVACVEATVTAATPALRAWNPGANATVYMLIPTY
jgi:hypothetical protein